MLFPGQHRYIVIANDLAAQILRGVYQPKQRLPSIRKLQRDYQVSISTIQETYRLLEEHDFVESKPQSGHFVPEHIPYVAEPRGVKENNIAPHKVVMSNLAATVLVNSSDPNMVQLGGAVPDPNLLPSADLNRILRKVGREAEILQSGYNLTGGRLGLRQIIAQRLALRGSSCAPDDILITQGATEAVQLALRATCKPGDVVVVESPCYYNTLLLLEEQKLRAVEIPVDTRHGFSIDLAQTAIRQHNAKAIIVSPHFQNPSGYSMREDNKRALVRLCQDCNVPLIEDDVFGDLAFDGSVQRSLQSYDKSGIVIRCSSVSKSMSPGYRVGWIIAGQYHNAVRSALTVGSMGSPDLTQAIIEEFFHSGLYDKFLTRAQAEYGRRSEAMRNACREHFPKQTRISAPSGGLVLWVELPDTVDIQGLHKAALDAGITFAPGSIFSPRQRYSHHLRLNSSVWDERCAAAITKIGQLIPKYSK